MLDYHEDSVYTMLYCWAQQIQDFSRFASITAPFIIVLAAYGVEGIL